MDSQAYQAQYHREHATALRAKKQAWYVRNRQSVLAKRAEYRAHNLEKIRARDREYCRKNALRNRQRVRAWQKANPDKVRASQLRRYYSNKDEWRERNSRWQRTSVTRRIWKAENRERLNAYSRRYYREHPNRREYLREWNTRSPKRLALLVKWRKAGRICYICGGYLKKSEISADHIHPRKHGGSHDCRNIMPAHGVCNSRKNARIDYPIARPDLVEIANG